MKRWKRSVADSELETLRDIRSLLYILALQGRDGSDVIALKRLTALEGERMEDGEPTP